MIHDTHKHNIKKYIYLKCKTFNEPLRAGSILTVHNTAVNTNIVNLISLIP